MIDKTTESTNAAGKMEKFLLQYCQFFKVTMHLK